MNKLYVLYHIHRFRSLSECLHEHEDKKLIGVFCSKGQALEVMAKYKNLEGFKNHLEGFHLDEYHIDSIYNLPLNELLEQSSQQNGDLKAIYSLYYVKEFEDGHDDVKLLGIFSSLKKSEEALAKIQDMLELSELKDNFSIHEGKVDQLDWTEGFVTLE